MKAEKQLPNKNPVSVCIEKYQRKSVRLSWFKYRQVTGTAQEQQGNKVREQIDSHNDGHRQPSKRRNQRECSAYRSKTLSENFSMNLEQRRISPRMGLPK